jgi:drug/metabolite transporter (DMT)-like permease
MPLTALALVITAACLHALWNFWLKKADAAGVGFVWASSMVITIAYAAPALGFYADELAAMGAPQWTALVVTAVLHLGYFFSLQRGYASADLSVVYPVARGVGPLLSALVAMAWFDETPSVGALAGLALIVLGTFSIAGGFALFGHGFSQRVRRGLGWGALTGVLIAGYTLNDARAVKFLGMAPLVLEWAGNALRGLALTPMVWLHRRETGVLLRRSWRYLVAISLVSPIGYMMVLEAMKLAPISHVAPARELSMLIAAFLGARVLAEGELRRRLAGAALIASGVACLALSR